MLSTLGDLVVSLIQILADVTLWLSDLATRPIRFLFSRQCRREVRQNWSLHPIRAGFEFIGGSVVLLLFVAMLSFWIFLFTVGAKEPAPGDQRKLKQQMIEKFRRPQKEKPKTG
jgi:hypothetical protein